MNPIHFVIEKSVLISFLKQNVIMKCNRPGSQVYLLTDPDDKVYMMQSYTTMVNPNVTIDTLPELVCIAWLRFRSDLGIEELNGCKNTVILYCLWLLKNPK
jgi:hypothetical protein